MRVLRQKKGFSLIELMIVVSIIGLLAAVSVPNFVKYKNKAKLAEVYNIFHGIDVSQEAYYLENNIYYYTEFGSEAGCVPCDGGRTTLVYTSGTYDPNLFAGQISYFYPIVIFGQADQTGTFTTGMDPGNTDTYKGGSGSVCEFPASFAKMNPTEVGINDSPAGSYDYYLSQAVGNFTTDGTNCKFLIKYSVRENGAISSSPIIQLN